MNLLLNCKVLKKLAKHTRANISGPFILHMFSLKKKTNNLQGLKHLQSKHERLTLTWVNYSLRDQQKIFRKLY